MIPSMKSWLLDSLTGLDALHLGEAPEPIAAAGEVVLSIQYAALNPADRYLAEGQYPARPVFPHILGRDGLGIVSAVGRGVSGIAVGEKLLLLRGAAGVNKPGTFAERVVVPVESLVRIPHGWSDRQAAGAPLTYLTAFQALTMWPDMPAGGVVLVTGASGGVGVATVQLAKAMGYFVVGLSRDAGKQATLRQLGADLTFSPSDTGWKKSLPRKVDLAIDNIAGPGLTDVIDSLADHGRVSCVGRLAGPVPQFNTASLFFRRIRMGGVAVGAYTPAESQAAWQAVLEHLSRTGSAPQVDSIFEFEDLKAAFARLAAGPMGKVLLAVGVKDGKK